MYHGGGIAAVAESCGKLSFRRDASSSGCATKGVTICYSTRLTASDLVSYSMLFRVFQNPRTRPQVAQRYCTATASLHCHSDFELSGTACKLSGCARQCAGESSPKTPISCMFIPCSLRLHYGHLQDTLCPSSAAAASCGVDAKQGGVPEGGREGGSDRQTADWWGAFWSSATCPIASELTVQNGVGSSFITLG